MKPEIPQKTNPCGPWSDETEARFWNHLTQKADREGLWFSLMVREGIVRYLTMAGYSGSRATVLDYGCGPGNLIEAFLNEGAQCYGIEKSAKTVDAVNLKFDRFQNWNRAVTHHSSESNLPVSAIDFITCIETLEHLRNPLLSDVLKDIFRLLRPGGSALITVPNDERLARNMVCCPCCSTEFHPVQHVRSFNVESLSRCLSDHQFEVVVCVPTDLGRFQKSEPLRPFDWSIRTLVQRLRLQAARGLDRISPRSFPQGREFRILTGQGPHLTAIARRPTESKAP